MNRKTALLLISTLILFFTIGSISASDVNATDSDMNLTDNGGCLQCGDGSVDVQSSMEDTSLKDTIKNQTEITANAGTVYYKGSYSVTLKDSNSSKVISNKTVNFIINNVDYAAVSDDGVASVKLSLNPGKYSVIAYFSGDDEYLPSNNFTSSFQVLLTVKATDITKYYKGNTPYTATFYDSNGKVLSNRKVTVSVNGKAQSIKTNTKGVASLPVDLKPGNYKITSTDPITGYKITTNFKILSTISSNNLNTVKGDGKKFVAQFFKSDGTPLAKKYVKIRIKGKIHKVKTNSNGKIKISLKKFKVGKYKVVLYNRDGLSNVNKIRIYKIATTKLTTDFYTFFSNDNKQIKAKLSTSLGGDSNSGKAIKIKINGRTYSKKTDAEGMVYIDAPSKKGLYAVEYSYNGNKFFKSSKTSNLVTVLDSDVPKTTVKSTTNFGYGAGTLFKVAFTAGGVPLAKRTATFTIGSKVYRTTTDNNGIASIPINLKIGKYTVQYKTDKKSKINATNGSCIITVFKRSDSKLNWKCGDSYKDSSQTFELTLTDSRGNGVSGQIVELTIDGETYTGKTSSNGHVKIKTHVALGKYKVSVKFKGSNDYLPSHNSKSINVKLSMFGSGLNEKNSISYLSAFLKSSSHCKVNTAKIKSLVKKLTRGKHNKIDKAKAIYNYVRDCIDYRYYYNSYHGSTGTLKAKKGNCVDQSHLLVAMYRTAGFKARYVHGKCTFSDGRFGHVWTQVLIDKHWVCGDPTNRKNALGKIGSWNTHTYTLHSKYQSLPF